MPAEQKILDKLQKLLALSASDNEHEAALALEKARYLMNEYNLTTRDVADDGSGADVNNQDLWGLTKSRQKWESLLGSAVAKTFDGHAVITKATEGWYFTFVATKTDMEIIVDLYTRLRQTIRRMSDAYVLHQRKNQPWLSPKTLHNSYRRGMVLTIHGRLQQLRENTRPDAKQQNRFGLTGKDLVMVKNAAVDQHMTELFGKVHTVRSGRVTVNAAAYNQGRQDGDHINLHRSLDGCGPVAISE